ncbi:hypothetical protein TIFTF001_046136 [Ficus carica]|uniref:Uncharacterized protein n=1 Tax=Ficus carica TaxID=3494 RepID=A0AA88CML9_FICCA|nr:hypothetical protein TIFTF001_046136 [Ficus carica]
MASWSHHEFFYLSRSRHSLASREDSTFQLTCFPNQDSGATARLLGSGSSGTTSKSLTMATRTLFGSRFQNAWIALPGRVEPFNSASYVVVASSSYLRLLAFNLHFHLTSKAAGEVFEAEARRCLRDATRKTLATGGQSWEGLGGKHTVDEVDPAQGVTLHLSSIVDDGGPGEEHFTVLQHYQHLVFRQAIIGAGV